MCLRVNMSYCMHACVKKLAKDARNLSAPHDPGWRNDGGGTVSFPRREGVPTRHPPAWKAKYIKIVFLHGTHGIID